MAASAMTEKQRLVVSIAVVAAGTLLLGGGWYLGLRKAAELEKTAAETRVKIEAAQKRLDRLDTLRRESRDRAALERRLLLRLPDTRELERVYALLEEVERQAGSAGGSIDFSLTEGKVKEAGKDKKAGPAPTGYEETLLELDAQGSWAGFVSFLDALEHADRLIAVRSFKTSGDADKDGAGGRSYKIILSVFSLKEPEKPKPGPGKS